MADTVTINFGFVKPEPGTTGWDAKLNSDIEAIDTEINNNKTNISALSGYADAGDAAMLTSAENYADTGDAAMLTSAENYADTGDAAMLTSAENYADTGDAATLTSIQKGSPLFGTDTGAADAYVVALNPTATTLAIGQEIRVKIGVGNNTNTGIAATLKINAISAHPIKTKAKQNPPAGTLPAGYIAIFIFDGVNFNLQNPARVVGSFIPVLYGTTSAGTPIGFFSGTYYLKEDEVHINIGIVITSKGGMSGQLRIKNLPYTQKTGYFNTVNINAPIGFTGITNTDSLSAITQNASDILILQHQAQNSDLASSAISDTDISNSCRFNLDFTMLIE